MSFVLVVYSMGNPAALCNTAQCGSRLRTKNRAWCVKSSGQKRNALSAHSRERKKTFRMDSRLIS